jgi:hypothetical protein
MAASPNTTPRGCDGCTLCCKVLAIDEIEKPAATWCPHCKPGIGCGIYADRPAACRDFVCGFLSQPDIGEEWRPSRSKMVLIAEPEFQRIAAHCDPQRPDAWRGEPYHSQLRQWAARAVATGGQVHACVRRHTYVILPDRDIDVGIVAEDELILTTKRPTPFGLMLDAVKLHRDDPRLREFT